MILKKLFFRIIRFLTPPDNWKLPVAFISGIFAGLGLYITVISNAVSYLSDAPETCINCHIMIPQYATWRHSSHGKETNCNDCHVPHNNIVNKYFFKAMDGLRHATEFTLRNEPEVIRIEEAGQEVVQENCKRCHEFLITNVSSKDVTYDIYINEGRKRCWDCHQYVPHDKVNSLSSTPHARVPQRPEPIPQWLKNAITSKK